MPALLHWPFFYWWGEGCNLSSSSGEISLSFEADERFWVTATLCQSSLIWLLRSADYNLISGALKINLCRAFCARGCVGAGSLIIHVYFFGPVKLLLCLNQVPTSISHDEAGSDGGVGCRSIKNPQLFSSKLRISQNSESCTRILFLCSYPILRRKGYGVERPSQKSPSWGCLCWAWSTCL